jgi:hypothetical protein
MGRLGVLAVGLGTVAAMTVTPGVVTPATPDIDVSHDGVALAATDIDISIFGIDIFNGGGTAHATSGLWDMSIAMGPNSDAIAEGGFGDFASAFTTGSFGTEAIAGDTLSGATGNDFDFATAFGDDSIARSGNPFGSVPDTTGSSFDSASAVGTVSEADAGFNGSGDYASAVGDKVFSEAGMSVNAAAPANFDSASVWGNGFTPTSTFTEAIAGGANSAIGGSNDLAFVDDPFGTICSTALAGFDHNFDLAGALGDNLTATSFLADFLAHIAPLF